MTRIPGQACTARHVRTRLVWAWAARVALVGMCACEKRGGTTDASTEVETPPPPVLVTRDRKDLLFTYAVPDGSGFATTSEMDRVPPESRRTVVVTDLSLTPEQRRAGSFITIADLSSDPRPDGTFPAAAASRFGFEASLAGSSTRTPIGDNGTQLETGSHQVTVYTTAWCGVCQRTKAFLQNAKVPFSERDVEASRSAALELQAKASSAGLRPGGVPVIDVAGILLQGFDETTLRRALRDKGFM